MARSARAVPGRGLEGDRYFERSGTFSDKGSGNGRDLTLIESEALMELARDQDIELRPEQARRNVLTSGVALNDLVGRRFRVGEVECIGRRLCDPCAHLEALTHPGVLRGLVDRGGLRADILTEGRIATGDELVELDVRKPDVSYEL
ncbi:MAG: MOSC domain-containing protein [Solirubrobacterales bacterium]